jgi:hypothetical protein
MSGASGRDPCNPVWCFLIAYTIIPSATASDSRSDEGAMLIHCNRGATTKTASFRRKNGIGN